MFIEGNLNKPQLLNASEYILILIGKKLKTKARNNKNQEERQKIIIASIFANQLKWKKQSNLELNIPTSLKAQIILRHRSILT